MRAPNETWRKGNQAITQTLTFLWDYLDIDGKMWYTDENALNGESRWWSISWYCKSVIRDQTSNIAHHWFRPPFSGRWRTNTFGFFVATALRSSQRISMPLWSLLPSPVDTAALWHLPSLKGYSSAPHPAHTCALSVRCTGKIPSNRYAPAHTPWSHHR